MRIRRLRVERLARDARIRYALSSFSGDIARNGAAYLDPANLAELQRLARSRPRSGRRAAAKASAIRTLERLERRESAISPCPPDWHPAPGTQWAELDDCYLNEHPELRERWWRNLEGGRRT